MCVRPLFFSSLILYMQAWEMGCQFFGLMLEWMCGTAAAFGADRISAGDGEGRGSEAEEKCKGREGRHKEKGAEEKRKGRGAG